MGMGCLVSLPLCWSGRCGQSSPGVPLVLAVWAKMRIHRDAHVQYLRCLYPAPFKLGSLLAEGVGHETPALSGT